MNLVFPLPSFKHIVGLRWQLIEMHGPTGETVVPYVYETREWWSGLDRWHGHREK